MGDAQSAQREDKRDAAAEEESGKVDDAPAEENIEAKPLINNGQISEISGKADGSIAEVNGHCEDKIAAEANLSPDEDVSETEKPLKEEEETPLENVEINEKESPNEADDNEDAEIIEMDAKQNDINEGFKRFFSNIGLKLTVKRGSETAKDVQDETNKEEPNTAEDVEDAAKDTKSENAEENTDVNIAQETYDNDSTTCPTLTDVTSEDVLENAEEEKTTETQEKVESDNAEEAATTPPPVEDAHHDATAEEEPHSTSPSSPEEEVVVSPIKRFFTTGIFSGLRKKKKAAEDETTDKELVDMGKKEVIETTEQAAQDQQQNKEETSPEYKENELKEEIQSASAQITDEGKSSSTDPSTIIVNEPEILSSQEKEKVQASPLKRLLSGSKKRSKKQRSRRSSDAKLSDSGEHVQDQMPSAESPENQKEEGPTQPSADAAGEEDSAWASFKKLMTPKKLLKRSSLSNEETQIAVSAEEPKANEGEQISDHSTEEGKKRKDSSVSWEAVLCGSGRRRSRKTSDSEDETPQADNEGGSKHAAESPLESSNENEILASSPKQAGSPSEGDGGSTWKSLKKLVTPKRKAKDEDESKDNIQSDSDVTQDESSFSIKKLLPGRKKRKSAEKQDQVSSDEADKDVVSGDEDSETPAVVPLSEFDTADAEVHIQTQADIESHIPEEGNHELQKELLDQMAEPVLPCDSLQMESEKVQDNDDASEKQASTAPATDEEPDDLTESISKHQQLSDIPEEGIISDTMVTPASVNEEAARDDTIAEDLIEITSEAITAPEPASDITLPDETEMISAVSQLSSESSKTSGNTTPVPAEYDVMETDTLLHQVVETISITPKSVPVFSDELSSERIAGSVSHQILETFVKEQPTILEAHRRSDATAIKTGLNAEELDAINELTATPQTESISEVNDSVSTEVVSEVPTEEFDTAEIAVDEVYEVTYSEESIKELEEGSLVEAHHAETEPPKIDSQEADTAATVTGEDMSAAETVTSEVNVEPEKEDELETEAAKTEDVQVPEESEAISEDIAPAETVTDEPKQTAEHVQEPEVLEAVQAPTIDSEVDSVQSVEKEVLSEDVPEEGTVIDEPKEETIPLNEVSLEPVGASKTEDVQVPEKSEAVQASTLDSEEISVQSPKDEVISEDIAPAETVTDEPKETAEHVQEPEVLEAVQAPTIDSEEGNVQSVEKEVISDDVPEEGTVIDEPKEETILLNEVSLEPVDASKTEDVQISETSEAVQASTLDSEESSVQSPKDDVQSEDIPQAETDKDEPKQTGEHVQEPEVLEAVQAPTIDSEEGNVQSVEKEVISDDVPEEGTVVDEPKQTAEQVQEPEVIEAAQAPTVDSEEGKDTVKSEDIAPAETATDEPKQTAEHLTEVSAETENKQLPVYSVKTEQDQESEVLEAVPAPTLHLEGGSVQSLEKEIRSEDIPAVETITGEPKKEDEPVEAAETDIQESKVLPSDELKTETKTVGEVPMQVVTESIEGGSAQEDILKPDNNNASALVTDETASEVVAQLVHEIAEDQKTESTPQDVTIKQEDCIPEVADELPALTAVHVSSVNEEASCVTVLGEAVISGETSAPCLDNAAVTDEPELQLSAVQVNEGQEKQGVLPGTEMKTSTVEHAVVAQVVVCNIKDVPVAIPDVFIEKTSDVTEPLIDTMASQLAFKEEVEAAAPFVRNDVAQTAKEGSVVMMMHVPSVTFEDNHRIQVQVVDVDIKSAETIVDSVLEVGVTETKEVIDVCHETVEKVDNLSATPETERELFHEENKVTIQEVIQHVKENLPETVSESVPEQEVIIQPDAVTKETETEDSTSPAVITADSANERQVSEENLPETVSESVPVKLEQEVIKQSDAVTKVTEMEDSIGETLREKQDEAPAVITDDSAKDRQVSEDLVQATDIAEGLDVSIHDHKVDLEETKTEQEKPEGVTAEEVKPSEAQIAQIVPSPIVTASNTGLVVPQNTGIISSIGNVESPSSLSLEFKLNIQFGQAKAPASPPPTTERTAPVKQTDVSEVGVQAVEEVEPVNPINQTETANGQKKTELTEVSVQATETTEPVGNSNRTETAVIMAQPVLLDVGIQAMEPVKKVEQIKSSETVTSSVQATETTEPAENLDLTERALIMTQPVQLDVGSQAMETVEPVEQIKSTERVTSTVQATETTQPVRPAEKRELFLSQPVVFEACYQEIKAEQLVKQTEEENEQDVWMDAEEVIYTQEETEQSFVEVEEPQEPQTASEPEEQAGPEVEIAPDSKTEEEESHQEMHKTGGTCEIESEAEDFAVAPEHQEVSSASVSTMEWD